MYQSKTKKIAGGIITVMIIVLLLNTIKINYKNSELRKSGDEAKLRSEKLLSEKLLLKKEIDQFKKEIYSLKGQNNEIDQLLLKANKNLSDTEFALNRLMKESNDAKALRAEIATFKKIKENLHKEIEILTLNNLQLKNKNEELNAVVKNLSEENKSLTEQIRAKSFTGSNFKVEVIKGKKDKLTIKAKKTNKIRIEFEVPGNSYPVESRLVHINLVSPKGSLQSGDTEVNVENKSELSASLSTAGKQDSQKVTIEYTVKEKLQEGTYTAIVFHNNTFFGNVQFRLMK